MKKILLSLSVFLFVALIPRQANAQCTVSDIIVDINTCNDAGADLLVNFDVSFKIQNNGGNKFIFIHSWKANQYPNYWNCNQTGGSNETKPPKNTTTGPNANTALANSFLNIAIDNNNAIPVLVSTYNPDPTHVTITPVSSISKVVNVDGSATITLTGVQVTIPGIANCTDPISVVSDVWSSQASAGQVVHCVNCNIGQFFNDPLISGIVPCFDPRRVNFALSSVQLNTSFYYRIYQDDGDEIFEPGGQDVDVTIGVNPTITTNGSGSVALTQYSIVQPAAGTPLLNYWISIVKVGSPSGVSKLLKPFPGTECAPLPVEFKSFTAVRNRSNVQLTWVTSSEKNNSGFAVERNINGSWQQIAWVPTQALNGNSDAVLVYNYTDLNNLKGISQYRIRQVDIDAKSKYSEIRSVRGEGQIGKTVVYPNPTNNGKVNIMFEEGAGSRDISVADMSGRVVRQIKGISSNNITIENLNPGMYTIRIVSVETGDQVVEKVVVNKR